MGLYNQSLNENVDNVQVNKKVGSGGSGTHFTRDVLLGFTMANADTIALAHDINDYDVLCLNIGNVGDTGFSRYCFVDVKSIEENNLIVSWDGYQQRNCHYKFNGNTVTKISSASPGELGQYAPFIVEIIGYKF